MPTSLDVLRASIETHNDTFESLLSLIPPKYYFLHEQVADTSAPRKYQKHSKNQKAPKQTSTKARREKLDPANQKSIIDIQNEAVLDQDDDENSMDVDAFNGLDDDDDDDDDMVPMPQVQSIAALRDKLHARIATLRRSGDKNDKPGDKDELLEERRKQRAALREKRRKETKERKRAESEHKKDKGKDSKSKPVPTKNQLLVSDMPGTSYGSSSHHDGPLTNIAFSALAGSTSKKAAHFKTAPNPTQALTQLTARRDKVASMPDDKRKTVEDGERWGKAEARIEGVKVKDNEGLLKKAIKRKEKEKARSKKKWDEKKEQVAASMAARQKKRADNIAMRNERRNGKGKGGKSRPGFEGKSFSKGKGKAFGRKK